MNPLHSNHPEQVSEQDLLAFHLSELPPPRADAVRLALAQDSALAKQSAILAATLAAVTLNAKDANRNPMLLDKTILDRNWQAIRLQVGSYPSRSLRWKIPALGGSILSAAAAGVALVAYVHHPASEGSSLSKSISQTTEQNWRPPLMQDLTVTPNGKAGSLPNQPGFHPKLGSGIYYSKSNRFNSEIHPIDLAPWPPPAAVSLPNEPLRHSPSPMVSDQDFTQESRPSITAANPIQDDPEIRTEPTQTTNLIKPNQHLSNEAHRAHPLDVMLGVGGTFIPKHESTAANNDSHTLSATHAILAIGSLHQQFRTALGYRITLSYSRPDLGYTYSFTDAATGTRYSQGGNINSRIFEVAGTYVVQGPHHKGLTTSVDAGAAFLAFLPDTSPLPDATSSFRAAGLLGVNFDYAITKHIGARLGYRAKVFKSPSFGYNGSNIPVSTPLVVDNEPSLGVTYTFGK
jgi:hypothetical protein